MSEKQFEGGAGPALAAHSKDASAPGQTPPSRATGNGAGSGSSAAADAARNTRQRFLDEADHAVEQAVEFVRDHPAVALTLTGAVCFAAGILVGRR